MFFPWDPPDKRLRVLMARDNLTSSELAQQASVSLCTVSRLRTGKTHNPQYETAYKISQVFGVKPTSIWPELTDFPL